MFIHGSNPLKICTFVILDVSIYSIMIFKETLSMLAKKHVDILCMNMTAKVNNFFLLNSVIKTNSIVKCNCHFTLLDLKC